MQKNLLKRIKIPAVKGNQLMLVVKRNEIWKTPSFFNQYLPVPFAGTRKKNMPLMPASSFINVKTAKRCSAQSKAIAVFIAVTER